MPELPEVEVKRRYLEGNSLYKPVIRVAVPDARVLENVTPSTLGRGLKRASFALARRRGKYILLPTDNGRTLLVHFGMTGDVFLRERGHKGPEWSRVEFHFRDGSCLYYTSKRLLGKIALFPTTDDNDIPDIARLGPEPFSRGFTFKRFQAIVSPRGSAIHSVLMNQELIAGIGNIYSDEITFQAGVRPDRKASSLSPERLRRVFDSMKRVLRQAIRLDADLDDYPDDFIIPHRKRGGRCPRCGGALTKKTIGGRSSYFCPACQN